MYNIEFKGLNIHKYELPFLNNIDQDFIGYL